MSFPMLARPEIRVPVLVAIFSLFAQFTVVHAQQRAPEKRQSGTVILTSLDGLGYRTWSDDAAMSEMRTLRRIVARGVLAEGMIQSFPSVTPAGHSAIWTGTYGDVSGIVTSSNPILPRSEHTFLERQSGFHPQKLWAEPIWLTAARQGIRVVAHQATQNYPFIPSSTGSLAENAPVLVSGYGPALLEPYGVIRPARTTADDAAIWQPPLPRSALPVKTISWKVQNVPLRAALVAEQGKAKGYTAMYVAADTDGPRVRVAFTPTEKSPPQGRSLARHFSPPLHLTIKGSPSVGYFRLFELNADGSDFLLLQMPLHRLALYDGKADDGTASLPLLKAAGGFLGNGPGYLYQDGLLGAPLYAGGDGTAERRYLEGMELVTRQLNRHTKWLWKKYSPQLLIDYSPYPDEMEHTWYGLARPDITGFDARVAKKIMHYRKWGYAVIDTRVALFDSLAGRDGHLLFVSDHGMAPVAKEININLALQRAGLLAYDDKGKIDGTKTNAVHAKYGVMINTLDWRGGLVALEDRKAVVDQVETALAAITDPQTNKRPVTTFLRPGADTLPGIGGDAGADIYFDLAPGYGISDKPSTEIVTTRRAPSGDHGFLPTRDDMLASFIARGPQFSRGTTTPLMHSIDVASVISDLLGISPPAQNRGKSPFAHLRRVP